MLLAAVSQATFGWRLGALVLLQQASVPLLSSLRRALPRRLLQHSFLGEPELQAAPDLLRLRNPVARLDALEQSRIRRIEPERVHDLVRWRHSVSIHV